MSRSPVITPAVAAAVAISLVAATSLASADPAPPSAAAQQEADRLFKRGVVLFKAGQHAQALLEFQRAYELAPHPLVVYNIATCYRELEQYPEAVRSYLRFLSQGSSDAVTPARLAAAKTELDALYARVARVAVKLSPAPGAVLTVDGATVTLPLEAPLILAPGEHQLTASAPDHRGDEVPVQVRAGEQRRVELTLIALDAADRSAPEVPPTGPDPAIRDRGGPGPRAGRFAIHAGFGTNAARLPETGAPALGVALALGSRVELGVDAIFVAYSVLPAVRVRLAGRALAVHAVAAAPISFVDGDATQTFLAGAVGLGLRLRATPRFALRAEAFASYAPAHHDRRASVTIPLFAGGELWF